jgi:hypothetical protein
MACKARARWRESRSPDVDLLSKQDVKAFLREMVIVREHVREAFAAHHLHGYTVRQAIGLVGARPIQRQSLQKLGARALDDTYTGVIEQPLDERHRFLTHVWPGSAQGRQQFRQDGIGGPDEVVVREGIAKGSHTGVPRVSPIQKRYPVERIGKQPSHRYRFGVP